MDTIFHIGPQVGGVKRDNHLPHPAVHHSYSINCGWYFLCLYLLSLCLHVTKSALSLALASWYTNYVEDTVKSSSSLCPLFYQFILLLLVRWAHPDCSTKIQPYMKLFIIVQPHSWSRSPRPQYPHPSTLLARFHSCPPVWAAEFQAHSDNKVCPRPARPLVQWDSFFSASWIASLSVGVLIKARTMALSAD